MRVALIGIGDVGKYLVEVFAQSKHDVVVLTSKEKEFLTKLGVNQKITDYSLDHLTSILADCDAVIFTAAGPQETYVELHTAILEACKRSKTCKKFIPSEWTVNVEDFPDQPLYQQPLRPKMRETLRQQTDVSYTIIAVGWFADYVLPPARRYIQDVGPGWPADYNTKTFQLYGPANQKVSVTSARDVAHATLALVEQDASEWREYTYLAAQTLTYREMFELLKKEDSSWEAEQVNFTDVLASISERQVDGIEEYDLRLMAWIGANELPQDRCLTFGQGILKDVKGRTIEELLQEAKDAPEGIL